MSDKGQGHGATLKFFSIYRNTNGKVNFCEADRSIKFVCLSDNNNIQSL